MNPSLSQSVVVYGSDHGSGLRASVHDVIVAVAQSIGALRRMEFGGLWKRVPSLHEPRPYYVPDDTLTAAEASRLGICGPEDLFGGVVPAPFVKTKAITHGLVDGRAARP